MAAAILSMDGEVLHHALRSSMGRQGSFPSEHVAPCDDPVNKMGSYVIRRSRVHGRGLFARTPYGPGELVGEYRGRIIDASAEIDTSSAWDSDPAYTLLFAIDDNLMIDAGVKGNSIRFINHSCDPNCETTLEDDRVFVHARRQIPPGEELTYDYNLRPGDPDDGPEAYPCRCGSENCRGTMIDADLLPQAAGRITPR